MVERTFLLIYLYGYYTGKKPNSKGEDVRILVDQHLIKWNNPPMTPEETKIIDDLYDEVMITMNIAGLNRSELRKAAK